MDPLVPPSRKASDGRAKPEDDSCSQLIIVDHSEAPKVIP